MSTTIAKPSTTNDIIPDAAALTSYRMDTFIPYENVPTKTLPKLLRPTLQEPPHHGEKEGGCRQGNRQVSVLTRKQRALLYHPYARLQREIDNQKSRSDWKNKFEDVIFTDAEQEGIPSHTKRRLYVHALEAHIDDLHEELELHNKWDYPYEDLPLYRGLEATIIHKMLASLEFETFIRIARIEEMENSIKALEKLVNAREPAVETN